MTRTSDPSSTMAWLAESQPAANPKKVSVDLGQVRYSQWMQSAKTHRRRSYLVGASCEFDGCGVACGIADPNALVFDHCHIHGWIRAVLCNAHNVRIAHLEAAWRQYQIDLTGTPYWAILMACDGCKQPS